MLVQASYSETVEDFSKSVSCIDITKQMFAFYVNVNIPCCK